MSFGAHAEWYLRNASQIAAFQNYVRLLETDTLPRLIGDLVEDAVNEMKDQLDLKQFESIRVVNDVDDGGGVYWFLDDSYRDDDFGIWLQLWLPRDHIRWLNSRYEDDRPQLAMYAGAGTGSRAKNNAKRYGEIAQKHIKTLPKGIQRFGEFDTVYYLCAGRYLSEVLTTEALLKTDDLRTKLVSICKEFTIGMLPALRSVRDVLRQGK
jgi:hypothetical protein